MLDDAINAARYDVAIGLASIAPHFLAAITRLDAYNTNPPAPIPDTRVSVFDGTAVVPMIWYEYALPPNCMEVVAVLVRKDERYFSCRRTIDPHIVAAVGGSFLRPAPYQPVYFTRLRQGSNDYMLGLSAGGNSVPPEDVEVWYVRRISYLHLETGDIDVEIPDFCFDTVVYRGLVHVLTRTGDTLDSKLAVYLKWYSEYAQKAADRIALTLGTSVLPYSQTVQQRANVLLDRNVRGLPPQSGAVR